MFKYKKRKRLEFSFFITAIEKSILVVPVTLQNILGFFCAISFWRETQSVLGFFPKTLLLFIFFFFWSVFFKTKTERDLRTFNFDNPVQRFVTFSGSSTFNGLTHKRNSRPL